jgi:hypothetical protein
MKRRSFLHSVAGALIPWPAVTSPQPIITDFGDGGYLVEVGCLRCAAAEFPGGSALEFNVYITDYPMPGMVRERRMMPSKTLKMKLERVGFRSVLEGHPVYPSLVAEMTFFPRPNEIAERLQQILRGCHDWTLLYHDPGSGK